MRTPWKPALALFLLAPLVGEYLLGNVTIRDVGGLVLLAPLYGGGALLIREAARRTGRGWPTILVLGLAYGLVEAGIFDGSLFSASYEGVDYDSVRLPVLGVSAFYGPQFVINHAVWSIGIPILLTEALTTRHRTTPWLGRTALSVTAVVYLAGGLLVRYDSVRSTGFQMAGVLVVALGMTAVAFVLPGPPPHGVTGWVPRPLLVGVAAFALSSAYLVLPANWLGVGLTPAIGALTAATVVSFARRSGWQVRHRVALGAGALMTYAWAGFLITGLKHDADPVAFAGNAVFAGAGIALIVIAFRRLGAVTAATQEVESLGKA